MQENLVKSKQRVKQHGEVFTPKWVVNDMLDMVIQDGKDPFADLDATFLEPAAGNGNFVVEILRRKLAFCKSDNDVLRAVKSIYAVELLSDNVEEIINRCVDLLGNRITPEIERVLHINIQQGDFLKKIRADGSDITFIDWAGDGKAHTLKEIMDENRQ